MNRPPANAPSAETLAAQIEAVARDSDRVAFAGLFRHFAPRIKAWLLRGGLADDQADELAQEALVLVWRKAALYDRGKAAPSTWVFTLVRNLRIDAQRRGRVRPESGAWALDEAGEVGEAVLDEAVTRTAEPPPSPDESVAVARRDTALRDALAELPDEQREILRLSFFEEHPHAAIAEALRLPLGTVKSRIRLAVGHLRRRLGHLKP